ncbi:MAG: insulinase family protein, partial [Acidobacteriota bacterium]
YGDDDPERRLQIVDEFLREGFERMEVRSDVGLQPPFDTPRRVVRPFAASENGGERKGMVTINWLLPETTDPELNLNFQILQYILLGMAGSPLRKALIDSGLGEGITGAGFEGELRQMYFSTGLKGIDPKDAEKVEEVVLKTLERLASEGIDPKTVEAAINTIEFRLRENNTGSYPRGLVLMLRALTTWLYDSDPLSMLAFDGPLSAIKACAASSPSCFSSMIERYFLKNQHRTTVVLKPEPGHAEREEAEERESLEALRKSMGEDRLREAIEKARELKRLQDTPDPPEALATIPMLKISDLERKNKTIPIEPMEHDGTKILYHDLFTNGIAYVDVALDLHGLAAEHLPYVPLLGRTLTEMGTEREDFVALTQRIGSKTGGIRSEIYTSTATGSRESVAWLLLRGKAMKDRAAEMLDIMREVLLTVRLDNRERFRQIVHEEKARQEQKLVPNGHHVVNTRVRAHFREADRVSEQMSGVSYVFFLRELARAVDEDWPKVLSTLEEVRRRMVNRRSMVFNVTMDRDNWKLIQPMAKGFLEGFPQTTPVRESWSFAPLPGNEAMIIPSQVNYVGKGANLYDLGFDFHGSTQVISGYLRTSWLWEKVRMQGGAYGAFCLFDRLAGTFTFASYRDPNLFNTVEIFDRTSEFLRKVDLTEAEITKGIVGAIGSMDSHLLPDAKGYVSLLRYLSGDSEEARQRVRDEILSTNIDHFRAFANTLDRLKENGIVEVLGSQASIEEAEKQQPGRLKTVKVL